MRAIVIEDEVNVRSGFIKMLNKFCPEVEVAGEAESVSSGYELITSTTFDLLFLDINLPDGTGFDLIKKIEKRTFDIIFVTAYDEYAIDAFKISASDYLLKPISPKDLKRSISQIEKSKHTDKTANQQVLEERLKTNYEQSEKIIVRNTDSIELITLSNILFCQAEGSYTTFFFKDNNQMVASLNLKEYERLLRPYGFERAHHSYLVNLEHIESLNKLDNLLMLKTGQSIPFSQRKKSTIVSAIESRFLG